MYTRTVQVATGSTSSGRSTGSRRGAGVAAEDFPNIKFGERRSTEKIVEEGRDLLQEFLKALSQVCCLLSSYLSNNAWCGDSEIDPV